MTVDANSEQFFATGLTGNIGLRRWIRPISGLLISSVFLYVVLRTVSLTQVWAALQSSDLKILPFAVVSLGCGYALRVTRWWMMLRMSIPRLNWTAVAAPFLIGIAANNVMPLRLGDVLRLFAFRQRRGGEPSRVAGTLLVERVLDLGVLLGVFAFASGYVAADGPLTRVLSLAKWAAQLGLAAAAIVFALPLIDRWIVARFKHMAILRRHRWMARLVDVEEMLACTIAEIGRPALLSSLFAVSVLIWAFEAGLFVITLQAFQPENMNYPAGIFAFVVATLATLVPSSPGYIGTFHFFAIQALLAFDLDQTTATAFAITAHLLLWLPTTIVGMIALCVTSWLPTRNKLNADC